MPEPLLARDFDRTGLVPLRHEVTRIAEQHGLADPARYRFVVAVNEITTNAVRHGGGRGRIELWRHGDRLYCRVSDNGPGIPAAALRNRSRPPRDAVSGRGLWLARQGCDLTTHSNGRGTTVTLICPAGPLLDRPVAGLHRDG
jgi:anti-sigma regulatory factor (Ser/Thr protein kinase)